MNYLLIEPKTKAIAPNIALMKWARWCENNEHNYRYIHGIVVPDIIPDYILMSCIFSYYSEKYETTIDYYRKSFPNIKMIIGGGFPSLTPKFFKKDKWTAKTVEFFLGGDSSNLKIYSGINQEIENLVPKYNVKIYEEEGEEDSYSRNKIVLYASRGCTNKCGYCAVPKLEGAMKSFKSIQSTLDVAKEELPNATSVVLYDNNFTEHEYFDNIVDELKAFGKPVDIHGLHVDAFTRHHAKRFSELTWGAQGEKGTAYLRFSFDKIKYADHIDRALGYVTEANIKASFFCYMLFNWIDSPSDFWKRIVIAQSITEKHGRTIFLFPQRFEPFMALKRNTYIGKKWDDELVRGVTKMYTFLHGFIPVTKTHNVFNWIGHTEEEFIQRAREMVKTNKLIKKECDPPTMKQLLKTI